MNVKTFDKNQAVHVLNVFSMVLALGVTRYFFDSVVSSHIMFVIGNILMTPVYLADIILNTFTGYTVSGNFNLMFMVLWVSYALPLTACYPLLMVTDHDVEALRKWYSSKGTEA